MQQEKRDNLLRELLIEERLEGSIIEIYLILIETYLEQCFPPEQYKKFNNLSITLLEESKWHKKAVEKIIKKYENYI